MRRIAVDQAVAGGAGVGPVLGHIVVTAHGDGDAALRIACVRLAELLLGDDEHGAVRGKRNSSTQAGNARAYNNKVDRAAE